MCFFVIWLLKSDFCCGIIEKLVEMSGRCRSIPNYFGGHKIMAIWEIIGGAVLLLVAIVTIIICLAQEQKSQDSMTAALTGASTDSFYTKNEGRSREAILAKITRFLGVLIFIITLALNIVPIFIKK